MKKGIEMRKVTIELKVSLELQVDEGIEISQVVNEMDYEFSDTTGSATVIDSSICDYEIKDSR